MGSGRITLTNSFKILIINSTVEALLGLEIFPIPPKKFWMSYAEGN